LAAFFFPLRGRLDAASLIGELFLACCSALLPLCPLCSGVLVVHIGRLLSRRRELAMSRLPRCACGRLYRPDRFNADRQKGCMRGDCPGERKRLRDRQRYQRKYHGSVEFREAEKARRAECRRQAKARFRTGAGPPPGRQAEASAAQSLPEVAVLRHTLTGMAAVLAGEGDGASVGEFLSACADRGRRLTTGMGLSP